MGQKILTSLMVLLLNNIRSYGGGGGMAISAMRDLNPALVRDGGDHIEAVTVDIHARNIATLCTNSYGPQENANISKKREFWSFYT